MGQLEKAILIYEFVISREPNNSQVLNNCGLTLKDLGRFDEALNNLILATRSNPNFYEAYLNLGNVYFDLAEFNLAIANYNYALKIKPNYTDALTNRGNIYFCLKEFEKALADHDEALEISPNSPNANWNKSLTLLMCGKYLDGWETYEWRHEMNKNNAEFLPRQFLSPLWLGKESLNNKIILIHSEQGLGDTIQFCRLISRVYELGAKIIFEVQTELEDLLSCLSPFAKIVSRGSFEEHYDFHIPLLSLPHALKIEPSSIKNTTSYLKASKEKTAFWRKKLDWCNEFRVGLVWSGGFRPNQPDVRSVHQRRNINLKEFEGFHVPGMQLFSLQKGYPAEEDYKGLVNQNWKGPIIIDYTDELNDFSDTAAFIENLDLVISVDTSSAHLAAALGKSIWLLNRYDSCWRWMSDTDQSLWYSTMKIYRQDEVKNWEKVICMVKADLIHLIKSKDIS